MKCAHNINWAAAATLAALCWTSLCQAAPPAAAAVTEGEALAAAQRGAQWITLLQEADGELGSFGGDWSLSALASVGINAADVRVSPTEPSAQDYYLSLWTGAGPGGLATDYERAILAAYAGGLQPSRLDAETNLVADLAAQFDGHELGGQGATNADAFGLLALSVSGAPSAVLDTLAQSLREQQDADGGWNFAAGAKTSEADITGAAIAALCTAGATPEDPALVQALAYLHGVQDPTTGGFVNSSSSLGLNTDTTSWVVSGLNACRIDLSSWVTAQGKTPLDFLTAQQNPDGSFQRRAGDEEEDLYATQDAVRALAGGTFTAPPPPRAASGEPAVRPAPTVALGTPVPMTLVIDAGGHVSGGSTIRMCKVIAPAGATVAQMLQAADNASSPAYCVSDLSLDGGRIARLNGVWSEPGKTTWEVRREGGAAEDETGETLGLGALVQVQLVPSDQAPPITAPPVSGTTGTPVSPAQASSTKHNSKGANHAKKTHHTARRCLRARRAHGRHPRGRGHAGHSQRPRRGSGLHTASAEHRHHQQHTHARPRKLPRHNCGRRPAARHRR